MHDFNLHEPATTDEAIALLSTHGDEACLIAGGTALVLAMRQRLLGPTQLVALHKIVELHGIALESSAVVRIGAMTTHAQIARSALVQGHLPMLAGMAARMANPQVRSQGTLGGNLCYADPATDPSCCLTALGARVVLRGPSGERRLAMHEFLVDYFTTAKAQDELLVQIEVPVQVSPTLSRYVRHLRTAAEHRPLATFGAVLQEKRGVFENARLVVGASTVMPTVLVEAGAVLQRQGFNPASIRAAALAARAELTPLDDARGSAQYRREVVGVVVERTLLELYAQLPT
jgi:aerobic carbon-monoxide dehydrogenase medium subunit